MSGRLHSRTTLLGKYSWVDVMKKEPVWTQLIERGFFEDRKTAECWIMAGKVIVNNHRVDKPGQLIGLEDEIVVKGVNPKYVGKGGLKLEGALSDFRMDVGGVIAIDAGASTGGFTDCLLQHGAAKVYAVDVGYGRLAGKLQIDPRVVAMERVNIGDVDPEKLDPKPTLATVDLSYLSLKKAIPIFAHILGRRGDMLCLVKPLFEVSDSSIRRTGKIVNPDIYRELLQELACFVREQGYRVAGITHSHITGNKGAREFFMRLSLNPAADQGELTEQEINTQIENAVNAVMELELFSK